MMKDPTANYRNALVYEQLIKNLSDLLLDYFGSDDYEILIEDMMETYGNDITNQAEDFAIDRFMEVVDEDGNDLV